MRDQMEQLRGELRRERGVDFSVRIGINTGEAVTGAKAGGGFSQRATSSTWRPVSNSQRHRAKSFYVQRGNVVSADAARIMLERLGRASISDAI
jgi:class 3 adenylate cyclase